MERLPLEIVCRILQFCLCNPYDHFGLVYRMGRVCTWLHSAVQKLSESERFWRRYCRWRHYQQHPLDQGSWHRTARRHWLPSVKLVTKTEAKKLFQVTEASLQVFPSRSVGNRVRLYNRVTLGEFFPRRHTEHALSDKQQRQREQWTAKLQQREYYIRTKWDYATVIAVREKLGVDPMDVGLTPSQIHGAVESRADRWKELRHHLRERGILKRVLMSPTCRPHYQRFIERGLRVGHTVADFAEKLGELLPKPEQEDQH